MYCDTCVHPNYFWLVHERRITARRRAFSTGVCNAKGASSKKFGRGLDKAYIVGIVFNASTGSPYAKYDLSEQSLTIEGSAASNSARTLIVRRTPDFHLDQIPDSVARFPKSSSEFFSCLMS